MKIKSKIWTSYPSPFKTTLLFVCQDEEGKTIISYGPGPRRNSPSFNFCDVFVLNWIPSSSFSAFTSMHRLCVGVVSCSRRTCWVGWYVIFRIKKLFQIMNAYFNNHHLRHWWVTDRGVAYAVKRKLVHTDSTSSNSVCFFSYFCCRWKREMNSALFQEF